MATKKSKGRPERPIGIESALEDVAKKLANCPPLKEGKILVRATGPGGGDYYLESSDKGVRLAKEAALDTLPVIEIIGDAKRIQSVLAGRKAAVTQFLAGGFRVRGDLRYLSDLALELGILKEPL